MAFQSKSVKFRGEKLCYGVEQTLLLTITLALPRVLELAKNAGKVTIVGPSTTLAPLLFYCGVKDLSGLVVKNCERAMRLIKGAEHGKIFSTGQKVAFRRA